MHPTEDGAQPWIPPMDLWHQESPTTADPYYEDPYNPDPYTKM